jgi:hypothetical protein
MKKGTAAEMLVASNWYEDIISCDGSDLTINAT